MPVAGRLELTIKINELPEARTVENNWKAFEIDCDGQIISVTVKPKIWTKLEQASQDYPLWVASISGRVGIKTVHGFILDQPAVQVFEKKPKEPASEGETALPQEKKAPPPPPPPKPAVVLARPVKKSV